MAQVSRSTLIERCRVLARTTAGASSFLGIVCVMVPPPYRRGARAEPPASYAGLRNSSTTSRMRDAVVQIHLHMVQIVVPRGSIFALIVYNRSASMVTLQSW